LKKVGARWRRGREGEEKKGNINEAKTAKPLLLHAFPNFTEVALSIASHLCLYLQKRTQEFARRERKKKKKNRWGKERDASLLHTILSSSLSSQTRMSRGHGLERNPGKGERRRQRGKKKERKGGKRRVKQIVREFQWGLNAAARNANRHVLGAISFGKRRGERGGRRERFDPPPSLGIRHQ